MELALVYPLIYLTLTNLDFTTKTIPSQNPYVIHSPRNKVTGGRLKQCVDVTGSAFPVFAWDSEIAGADIPEVKLFCKRFPDQNLSINRFPIKIRDLMSIHQVSSPVPNL